MAGSKSPVVVVLHGKDLPAGMDEVEAVAEVRYVKADGLAAALPGADVLFLWDFFSSAVETVWEHADSLKWIHVAAAGVDKLLFDELNESDVVVTNARGIFDRPIAEFVLASILAIAKDIPGSLRRQEKRQWEHRETERIDGTKALIVGTGAIGRATARMLTAMELTVVGVGRTDRVDPDFGVVHASDRLADVVADADWLVLIAPLTDATRNMVDKAVLDALKPTARVINVGRGELIDDDALVDALASGGIAGAALDVFSTEPLPDSSPLWAMENVLISSHLSGDAVGWLERLSDLFRENFDRYVRGADLVNVVDKQLGFVPN
ncbi:D-2-hydroxyacid dehydrogenase [Homoserinimonas sp. OAct 916]|uniref:D-2-hydroxyacid dehydrogenase n=1 Tax=Homoserinimonas sp. OAct 916 TaxID=2211450 RepID=UPI0027299BBA|nr:D-2-hydroxyacid dehydrogenase [Homoserinimonas sp. OAct 916]